MLINVLGISILDNNCALELKVGDNFDANILKGTDALLPINGNWISIACWLDGGWLNLAHDYDHDSVINIHYENNKIIEIVLGVDGKDD